MLALVGEAGIGKTTLLEYAAEHAGSLRLLRARGIESEAQIPFAALLELLRPALGLLERIPEPQANALEAALALRPRLAVSDRFAVGAGTLSLLAAYADESPTLLLLDDAHLLDPPSAEALLFALRRLLAEPVGAVLAVRAGESSLLDVADLPQISVGGLDAASCAALLGSLPAEQAERLIRATGGNPLALLELGSDAGRIAETPIEAPVPVPATVARSFARRVERLDEDVRKLLLLLAASDTGELATVERAAKRLGLDLARIDDALETGLVKLAGGLFEFSHPLARAAVYGAATPEVRREAHRALAGALPDRDGDRRAWHLAIAVVGTDDAATAALEQAGARAMGRGAYSVAAMAFERAAQLATSAARRGSLLLAAAESAWLAGLAERAVALLADARESELSASDAIQVEHLRGRIATRRGPVMEGCSILVAAAEQAAREDADLAVTMLAEAVEACFYAGDARAMTATATRAGELLGSHASLRARFLAAMTRGMALVFTDRAKEGIAAIREAVALAERHEQLRADALLLPWLVMGPLWLREDRTGEVLITTTIEAARAEAALGVLPWLLNRIARLDAGAEKWTAAEVEYDEAIRLARETGQLTELATGLAGLAWLEARQGREELCRARVAEARSLCATLGVGLFDSWALRALGDLELGLGRAGEAVASYERVVARLDDLGIADVDLLPGPELVEAYLRLGRREDAQAAADRMERAAGGKDQPWAMARSARCRGMLAHEHFEQCFEAAISLHEQTPDTFEMACTRLAYGARLRRSRQRRGAREQLRAALEMFEALGAMPWVSIATRELDASGERARRRDASTRDELTHQELHIAQLLAEGRTTREAAAALFLSPKTIEYHLRSIYRKLGVKSRADLAGALLSR